MNSLPFEKKVTAIAALAEGSSIRGVERMTGIHCDTIMRLGVRVGEACSAILDQKMRGLPCDDIQVDEAWRFIGAKQKNAATAGAYGDVWTFIALDRKSKVIPSFVCGKRDLYHATAFMDDLATRLANRPQITNRPLKKRLFPEFGFDWSSYGDTRVIGKPWNQRA